MVSPPSPNVDKIRGRVLLTKATKKLAQLGLTPAADKLRPLVNDLRSALMGLEMATYSDAKKVMQELERMDLEGALQLSGGSKRRTQKRRRGGDPAAARYQQYKNQAMFAHLALQNLYRDYVKDVRDGNWGYPGPALQPPHIG